MNFLNCISFFIYLVIFSLSAEAIESGWRIKTFYEKVDSLGLYKPKKRSVVVFKNNLGDEKTYKPDNPPFGMVGKQKIQLDEKEFFVTSWPMGAHSFNLRIFDPSLSEKPLCEVITFSSQMSVRMQEGKLQVEKVMSGATQKKIKKSWEKCHSYKK
jgi:hypothetical protein